MPSAQPSRNIAGVQDPPTPASAPPNSAPPVSLPAPETPYFHSPVTRQCHPNTTPHRPLPASSQHHPSIKRCPRLRPSTNWPRPYSQPPPAKSLRHPNTGHRRQLNNSPFPNQSAHKSHRHLSTIRRPRPLKHSRTNSRHHLCIRRRLPAVTRTKPALHWRPSARNQHHRSARRRFKTPSIRHQGPGLPIPTNLRHPTRTALTLTPVHRPAYPAPITRAYRPTVAEKASSSGSSSLLPW